MLNKRYQFTLIYRFCKAEVIEIGDVSEKPKHYLIVFLIILFFAVF